MIQTNRRHLLKPVPATPPTPYQAFRTLVFKDQAFLGHFVWNLWNLFFSSALFFQRLLMIKMQKLGAVIASLTVFDRLWVAALSKIFFFLNLRLLLHYKWWEIYEKVDCNRTDSGFCFCFCFCFRSPLQARTNSRKRSLRSSKKEIIADKKSHRFCYRIGGIFFAELPLPNTVPLPHYR